MMMQTASEENGQKTGKATLVALFLGPPEKLVEIVNQNIPSLKLQRQECIEMSWIESTLFWANFPNGTAPDALLKRDKPTGSYLKRRSDYVRDVISKKGIEDIWKVLIEIGVGGLTCNPQGGKMNEISETATPFPHRAGVKFMIQHSSNWKEDGVEKEKIELSRKLYEAMTPFVTKNPREAFLNYRDIDVGSSGNWSLAEGKVYGDRYFKGNFERLVSVKTKVDPQNFFRNEQSIPTR
uniref:Berberine/berberine-like domain-containing protein n=2 Tax=Cucumis sativus TaxID=3659 RepID=A0A0A0KID0_CUCSA